MIGFSHGAARILCASVRSRIEYLFYGMIAAVVPLLPRWLLVPFGRSLGSLFYWLDRRGRETGMENLRRFLPGADPKRVLREGARLQAVALLDALWSRRLTPGRARACLEVTAEVTVTVDELAARDKGMVLATAHFGSWEMLNVASGAMGLPKSTVIARRLDNRHIDASVRKARERTGNKITYRERATIDCLGALKRRELVCSVIDMGVRPHEGGQWVDFMGLPAMTSVVLPFLAHRLRAPLAFIAAVPVNKGMRYRLEITEVPIDYDADRKTEVPRAARELNRLLEDYVRSMPEAWIWNYKRWKLRPTEHCGSYPTYSHWVMSVQDEG
jgi:KDO2-lipid IV(A) lauroyltransferase